MSRFRQIAARRARLQAEAIGLREEMREHFHGLGGDVAVAALGLAAGRVAVKRPWLSAAVALAGTAWLAMRARKPEAALPATRRAQAALADLQSARTALLARRASISESP